MHSDTKDSRVLWIDFVKAVAIVLVVYWHLTPIAFTCPDCNACRMVHAIYFFVASEITLLAVPLFLFVSLFLFYTRLRINTTTGYFGKRLIRLVGLFAFWLAVQYVVGYLATDAWAPLNWSLIQRGGPSLPIVGGSVFYYLFVLIALMLLTAGLSLLPSRARTIACAALVGLNLLLFQTVWLVKIEVPFWATLNFLYIAPLAILLVDHRHAFARMKPLLTALVLLLVILDAFLFWGLHRPLNNYFRAVEAAGICLVFAHYANRDRPGNGRGVAWLARYSLGIFALHKYALYFVLRWYGPPSPGLVPWIDAGRPAVFVVVFLATCGAVHLLSRVKGIRYMVS